MMKAESKKLGKNNTTYSDCDQTKKEMAKVKAQLLSNWRLLDLHKWSEHPAFDNAVEQIYLDLAQMDEWRTGHSKARKKHLKVLLLNLYSNWLADPNAYTAYYRRRGEYRAGSRYNELQISYLTVAVADALVKTGYVEHHRGFHALRGISRMSRMRASGKLKRSLRSFDLR